MDRMDRTECLEKAIEVVNGQREQDYGKPENNLGAIAELWTDIFGCTFNSVDVCLAMIELKISRIKSGHATMDSFVDICGYAAIGAEMQSMINE